MIPRTLDEAQAEVFRCALKLGDLASTAEQVAGDPNTSRPWHAVSLVAELTEANVGLCIALEDLAKLQRREQK